MTAKVVAITGASAGIGRATALRMARSGASVAICARRRKQLDDAAVEIVRMGGQALAFHAARAALPVFRRQGSGHVIVISSIVGKRGVPYMGAYAATKFAQAGFVECLRSELDGSDIHATVVYPISTDTEFFDVMQRESGSATRAMGPRQSADEVAEAIARAIDRPRAEVFPYRLSRGLAVLNAIAPGHCDRIVRRWGRRPVARAGAALSPIGGGGAPREENAPREHKK